MPALLHLDLALLSLQYASIMVSGYCKVSEQRERFFYRLGGDGGLKIETQWTKFRPIGSKLDLLLWCALLARLAVSKNPTKGQECCWARRCHVMSRPEEDRVILR